MLFTSGQVSSQSIQEVYFETASEYSLPEWAQTIDQVCYLNHPRILSHSKTTGIRRKGKQDGTDAEQAAPCGCQQRIESQNWKKYYILVKIQMLHSQVPKGCKQMHDLSRTFPFDRMEWTVINNSGRSKKWNRDIHPLLLERQNRKFVVQRIIREEEVAVAYWTYPSFLCCRIYGKFLWLGWLLRVRIITVHNVTFKSGERSPSEENNDNSSFWQTEKRTNGSYIFFLQTGAYAKARTYGY